MENRIAIALKNAWIGKQFVYVSKYGSETIGEIEDVILTSIFSMDKESSGIIREIVKQKSDNKPGTTAMNRDIETKKSIDRKDFKWFGSRPEIRIQSTNGQIYKLEEIYILSSL